MSQTGTSYTSSELHQFLRSRRSVRRLKPDTVPEDVLLRILDTTRFAPSAHNRQPWRFAVIRNYEARARLAKSMGREFRRDLAADGLAAEEIEKIAERSYSRIVQAPVVVVLCLTMSDMDVYPDRKRSRAEFRMAMQSVALAGGQMLLAAHAEGLGAVWVCAPLFAQQVVQQALDLPDHWEPHGMILMGYPEVIPNPRDRKPVEDLVLWK